MNKAIVSIGANVADRLDALKQALSRISFSNSILSISDVYETFGRYEKRSAYLNCCVEVETDMTSQQFMLFLIETQKQVSEGKTLNEQVTPLDLDLISFGEEITRTPALTLPHPEAHRRAFVMIPLAQIKPQWAHPLLGKTAEEIAKNVYWHGWGTFFASGKSLLDF